jgi:hypothetical protein
MGWPVATAGVEVRETVEVTIEMSRSEAYEFSEWLDAVVTGEAFLRGSKGRGTKTK